MTEVPISERLVLRVEEAAALLSVSRAQAYALIARGEIPSVRVGKAVRVPRRALEAWLDAQTRHAG